MKVTIDLSKVEGLLHRMRRFSTSFDQRHDLLLDRLRTETYQNLINNSSSPPGPSVRTGAYLAGLSVDRERKGIVIRSRGPQAARLEFGFYGVDSLGRLYHQAPRPHIYPTLYELRHQYAKEVRVLPLMTWRSL